AARLGGGGSEPAAHRDLLVRANPLLARRQTRPVRRRLSAPRPRGAGGPADQQRGHGKHQKGCDQAPPIAETSHLRSSLSPPTGLAAGLAADPSGGILATGRSRSDSPLPAHLSGSGSPAPARRAGLD